MKKQKNLRTNALVSKLLKQKALTKMQLKEVKGGDDIGVIDEIVG